MNEVQELAAKAADEIEKRGWWQGSWGDDTKAEDSCPVCLVGAVRAALVGTPFGVVVDPVFTSLWEEMDARVGTPGGAADWNDEEGRTQDEVVNLLRSIAAGE